MKGKVNESEIFTKYQSNEAIVILQVEGPTSMVSTASAETMHTGRIHHSRHQLHYSALLETYHGAYYCALYSSPDHYSNKKCHIQLTQQSFSLRVLVLYQLT